MVLYGKSIDDTVRPLNFLQKLVKTILINTVSVRRTVETAKTAALKLKIL